MFGSLGMPELIIIFVVALIIFGPRKLPELGRSLGRSLNEFKRASNELRNTLEEEVRVDEQREAIRKREAVPVTPEPGADTPATETETASEDAHDGPQAVEHTTPRSATPV